MNASNATPAGRKAFQTEGLPLMTGQKPAVIPETHKIGISCVQNSLCHDA
jgi:hypothetical protein